MNGYELIIQNLNEISKDIKDGVMIEIGSSRESHSSDILAKVAADLDMHFITIDPNKRMYDDVINEVSNVNPQFEVILDFGEKYLEKYDGLIHLICFDAFDNVNPNWPHKQRTIDDYKNLGLEITNEASWKMHLDATKASYKKIVPKGYISFNDTILTRDGWDGKGKYAVPFLLNNNFEVFDNDYNNCVILRKNDE